MEINEKEKMVNYRNQWILENGKIKNQGTFKELIKINKDFRLNAQN